MCMESAGVHEFFVLLMQEPAAFGQILQFTYALGLASPTTKPSDGNCCCVSGRTHKHKPLTKQQSPTEGL